MIKTDENFNQYLHEEYMNKVKKWQSVKDILLTKDKNETSHDCQEIKNDSYNDSSSMIKDLALKTSENYILIPKNLIAKNDFKSILELILTQL